MEKLDANYSLILLGLGAIILEILLGAVTGFDLLLIGVIFIIGGSLGMLFSSFNFALIAIVVLSFLYIILGRKFIRQKLTVQTKATNVDNLIGKTAVVTKSISPEYPGQIKLEGEIWRASAEKTIEKGDKVVVQSISGVTAYVK